MYIFRRANEFLEGDKQIIVCISLKKTQLFAYVYLTFYMSRGLVARGRYDEINHV